MMRWLPISRLALLGLALAAPLAAAAKEPEPDRFRVKGPLLIFDTETGFTGGAAEISIDDIARLREVLGANPGIAELQLNSSGGSVYAGGEMAWIVADYGLNTLVDGECVSACVDVFLAGARRRMTLGSKIGFHQRSWSPDSVERYYNDWSSEQRWKTPFDFASWVYEDTQREVYEHLSYMLSRGVEAAFAIETLRVDTGDEWYPSRLRLIAAGVLREEAGGN